MQTICALSTPKGVGGIGVIRVSGAQAIDICGKIVFPRCELKDLQPNQTVFAKIRDGQQTVDEIMVTVFKGPASFTGEDTVELSCHGGMYIVNRVIKLLLANGCAPAGPGEFTKRAFLNGKMDLTQAEAVIDLIHAQSRLQAQNALRQMDGLLGRKMEKIRLKLMEINTEIMAYVDYPEETIGEIDEHSIFERLKKVQKELEALSASFEQGQIIKEGVLTAIVGRPNVGKSTLMNALLQQDKSIVTDVAGTTRDLVEDSAVLGDLVLRLTDTAGIRQTDDRVEQIGVDRAKAAAQRAQLILAVVDASEPLTEQDREIFALCADKPSVLICNKADKPVKLEVDGLPFEHVIFLSAKEESGLDKLADTLGQMFLTDALGADETPLTNARQQAAVQSALENVRAATQAMGAGHTPDLVGLDIESAAQAIGELTGQSVHEQMIDDIFSRFCVGK